MYSIRTSSSMFLLSGALFLCAIPSYAATPPDTLLGFVVLGEKKHALKGETVPLVRIVLESKDDQKEDPCKKMALLGPDKKKPLSALVRRDNPSPKSYPITVCEAILPFSDKYLPSGESWTITVPGKPDKVYAVQLPTVVKQPEQIFIMGDTGCRDRPNVQSCDSASWPFSNSIPQDIARQIQENHKPSLLIHVGDYKYRGGKDDNKAPGGAWNNWRQEFFAPLFATQPNRNLFAMLPLVLARGNHELCDGYGKNGPGWFYLLDTASSLLDDSKEILEKQRCTSGAETVVAPYRLDFDNQFSLLIADSSTTKEAGVDDAQAKELTGMFTTIDKNFSNKESKRLAWFITHKPIWSAIGEKGKISNATEQKAVHELPHHTLPEQIQLVLSGHRHLFSSVEFIGKDVPPHPLSLTVGDSGVEINCQAYNGHKNDLNAMIQSMNAFGYVDAQLNVAHGQTTGWTLHVHGYDWKKTDQAETVAACRYPAEKKGEATCKVLNPKFFPSAGCKTGDGEE